MAETTTLTEIEKKKIATNILMIRYAAGSIGTIGGAVIAYKKQKGFWGYIGFMLLGSILVGSIATVATIPMASKISE